MATVSNIQELFFEEIKSKIPSTTSLVEEVAELLNVSSDSAYRRLRLKTLLTFQEVSILASHFNISVDKYLNATERMASFSYKTLNETSYDFLEYLKSILRIKSIPLKQLKCDRVMQYSASRRGATVC